MKTGTTGNRMVNPSSGSVPRTSRRSCHDDFLLSPGTFHDVYPFTLVHIHTPVLGNKCSTPAPILIRP